MAVVTAHHRQTGPMTSRRRRLSTAFYHLDLRLDSLQLVHQFASLESGELFVHKPQLGLNFLCRQLVSRGVDGNQGLLLLLLLLGRMMFSVVAVSLSWNEN